MNMQFHVQWGVASRIGQFLLTTCFGASLASIKAASFFKGNESQAVTSHHSFVYKSPPGLKEGPVHSLSGAVATGRPAESNWRAAVIFRALI